VSGRGLDLSQEAFGFIESLDDLQTGRAVLAAMDRAFALFGFENFRPALSLSRLKILANSHRRLELPHPVPHRGLQARRR
jgi:hypothetical protein